jgi:hypothetical protein
MKLIDGHDDYSYYPFSENFKIEVDSSRQSGTFENIYGIVLLLLNYCM